MLLVRGFLINHGLVIKCPLQIQAYKVLVGQASGFDKSEVFKKSEDPTSHTLILSQ